MEFQSTLPARGATYCGGEMSITIKFQSTLPARGATIECASCHYCGKISIHAPRTGSDHIYAHFPLGAGNFNPRSPHGERRARRWTACGLYGISIHAPRTGSDDVVVAPRLFLNISIHAPRTGSDLQLPEIPEVEPYFNPRSPHGERPDRAHRRAGAAEDFNPRSPHGERRRRITKECWQEEYFNPRSPHGERQRRPAHRGAVRGFQSTLPARGATRMALPDALPQAISIHAPRTGSDMLGRKKMANVMTHFNPRSPHGERQSSRASCPATKRISIHAPRTGSDADVVQSLCVDEGFQSTLPARGATPQVVF